MASDATARAAEALLAYRHGGGPTDLRARDLCRRLADAIRTNGTVGPHTTNSPAFLKLGLELIANRDPEVRALVDALASAVSGGEAPPRSSQTVNVTGNGNQVYVAGGDLHAADSGSPATATGQTAAPSPFTVLFAAASPEHEEWLRVDREARAVREVLDRAGLRQLIRLEVRMAVRPQDFLQALLALRPRVVHFAGHGDPDSGELCFEDEDGGSLPAAPEGLRVIFSQLRGIVECVILNARHGPASADAIVGPIPYVIAPQGALDDSAALTFSTGFYQALGEGRSVPEACEWGRGLLLLTRRGSGLPELVTRTSGAPAGAREG
ncbi:MAG TPA: CHAT domain-containing protein [Longimicrobium sp.]|nr:CHAT domain-containing protein [Longimicrobium sp.]